MTKFSGPVLPVLVALSAVMAQPTLADHIYLKEIINSKPWAKYTSERVHLYCFPGSEAERDKDVILDKRKEALDKIEGFFGRRAPRPIKVFLYPSSEDAKSSPVGTTYPASLACFNLYQSGKWSYEKHNYGHEMTHIFSNMDADFRRRVHPIGLLDEGLAEYLSGFSVDPHLRITQHWQAHGVNYDYIRIRKENLEYNSLSLYQIGGSFVKFLIESHENGREKFLALLEYTNRAEKGAKADYARFRAGIEKIYESPYDEILVRWNKVLKLYWKKRFRVSATDRREIQGVLTKAGYGKIERIYYNSFGHFLNLGVFTSTEETVFVEATRNDQWIVKR